MLGDVQGNTILDVGCGSGAEDVELLVPGPVEVVGFDVSGHFVASDDPKLTLVHGDLSNSAERLTGRRCVAEGKRQRLRQRNGSPRVMVDGWKGHPPLMLTN